jgi:hypothetical protein
MTATVPREHVPRHGTAYPRRHRWPTYLVSAPHEVHLMTGQGDIWVPRGEWHARKVGSPATACGLPAVTCHFFWTLRFEDAMDSACPACFATVRAANGA